MSLKKVSNIVAIVFLLLDPRYLPFYRFDRERASFANFYPDINRYRCLSFRYP